jgi:YggT family protein
MSVLATLRGDVVRYVDALFLVYTIIIVAYVVTSLIFSMGVRVPFSRPLHAVLEFLRSVSEPYLRIFRRFIPMIGPLDITPIVAIFVLRLLQELVVRLLLV